MRLHALLLTLGLASVCATSVIAQPAAPAALVAAVAATQAAKADYAFDFQLETSEQTWRARFEPNADPRLRLVAPSRNALDDGARRAFDGLAERMEGVSWCASEGMDRVGDVRLLREDATTATYSFQPTRESVRGGAAQRFADRLRGEFTLTKVNPDIAAVRIYAPAAFSPIPLTRLDTLNINIRCQPAPNGRHYAAETVMEMRGSAFGQAFNERTIQRAANLSAP